jgi:hypothetical protein
LHITYLPKKLSSKTFCYASSPKSIVFACLIDEVTSSPSGGGTTNSISTANTAGTGAGGIVGVTIL